jgi:hypothetical protein
MKKNKKQKQKQNKKNNFLFYTNGNLKRQPLCAFKLFKEEICFFLSSCYNFCVTKISTSINGLYF